LYFHCRGCTDAHRVSFGGITLKKAHLAGLDCGRISRRRGWGSEVRCSGHSGVIMTGERAIFGVKQFKSLIVGGIQAGIGGECRRTGVSGRLSETATSARRGLRHRRNCPTRKLVLLDWPYSPPLET
jgi:hypothetical protein